MDNASPDLPDPNLNLYRDFLAERDEILRHKWLKSETVGRDIGFEAALVDWMLYHRAEFRSRRAGEAEKEKGSA